MPAEDAGLATVYLIAKLAAEYHGEVVDGYEVLERAGCLRAPDVERVLTAAEPASVPGKASPEQALALVERLRAILAETGTEFEKLPIFARPLARRGLKAKSGQSLQVWVQTLEALHAHVLADDVAWLQAELPRLRKLLERLAVYYDEVPQETAPFTRDAAVLQEVGRIAAERRSAIQGLLTILTKGEG
jgi:hypothetical protein